jgi:hypothetical protein
MSIRYWSESILFTNSCWFIAMHPVSYCFGFACSIHHWRLLSFPLRFISVEYRGESYKRIPFRLWFRGFSLPLCWLLSAILWKLVRLPSIQAAFPVMAVSSRYLLGDRFQRLVLFAVPACRLESAANECRFSWSRFRVKLRIVKHRKSLKTKRKNREKSFAAGIRGYFLGLVILCGIQYSFERSFGCVSWPNRWL